MISSVLHREFLEITSTINIAFTPCESASFEKFIRHVCKPCNLVSLDETYYGLNDISVVICNNRLTHLDKSIELSKFLFCPLIIVDHSPKSNIINNNLNMDISIDPVYQIATSKEIYKSWNKIQNVVMEYDINNSQYIKIWKNLMFQLCKSTVMVKDEQTIKT